MQTNAGQGWTPGNATQDAGDEGKDANKRGARLDTRQCCARCWGRGERCELGKAAYQAMLRKMLVTRGKKIATLGKAGHQAMLCKMLVTRGKMRTNAGQGWTPGNAMQDAGHEGKDANKRWARLDTRQCYARCW